MDKEVIALLKDLPYVIAICLFGWLTIKSVMTGIIKLLEIWRDATKERNAIETRRVEVDSRRNDVEEKTSRILEEVTKRLEKLAESDREFSTKVLDQHGVIVSEIGKHDLKVGEIVGKLEMTRDEQFKALQERLDEILEKIDRVESCTKNMPVVAEDVATLSKMVNDLKELITKEEANEH